MEKIKVAFVTPVDPRHSFRGTENTIYKYAAYLNKNGIDATVLVPSYHLNKKQNWTNRTFRLHGVKEKKICGFRLRLPFKYDLYYYYPIPRDAIVYLPYSPYTNILNLLLKPRGQKYIIGLHGLHLRNGRLLDKHESLERIFVKTLTLLVLMRSDIKDTVYYHAINKEQISYLVKHGVRRKNIFHVPPSIDVMQFRSMQKTTGPVRVIHIGGIQKDANVLGDVIVELMQRGKIHDFEFYLFGRDQPESLKKLAQLNSNLHIMRSVGEKAKLKFLSDSDVMMAPALEAFSATILEGLASGDLIITRKDNPQAKELEDEKIYLLTCDGLAAYTAALLKALDMKREGKITRFGKSNIKTVEKSFSENIIMPRILDMFMNLSRG